MIISADKKTEREVSSSYIFLKIKLDWKKKEKKKNGTEQNKRRNIREKVVDKLLKGFERWP